MSEFIGSLPIDLGFENEVVVMPVIHTLNSEQARRAANVITNATVEACFIINHHQSKSVTLRTEELLALSRELEDEFPLTVGVNVLGKTFEQIYTIMHETDTFPFALWHDRGADLTVANRWDLRNLSDIKSSRSTRIFGGVAFKHQADYTDDPEEAAVLASRAVGRMDVVTTSGPGTNMSMDFSKAAAMSQALNGGNPFAIASGINPENANVFASVADYLIVGSSIETSPMSGEINEIALRSLLKAV